MSQRVLVYLLCYALLAKIYLSAIWTLPRPNRLPPGFSSKSILIQEAHIESRTENLLTQLQLVLENVSYQTGGGVSRENRGYGFRPAFFDTESRAIYESRFADGTPAPFHLLDGLPVSLVLARDGYGRVTAVKASVVYGFFREGVLCTWDEAARSVMSVA